MAPLNQHNAYLARPTRQTAGFPIPEGIRMQMQTYQPNKVTLWTCLGNTPIAPPSGTTPMRNQKGFHIPFRRLSNHFTARHRSAQIVVTSPFGFVAQGSSYVDGSAVRLSAKCTRNGDGLCACGSTSSALTLVASICFMYNLN